MIKWKFKDNILLIIASLILLLSIYLKVNIYNSSFDQYMYSVLKISGAGGQPVKFISYIIAFFVFVIIYGIFLLPTIDFDKKLYISNPKSNIAVGSIQMFLDEYLKDHEGKLDYIHGDETTRSMGKEANNVAILFEAMPKEELFRTVILDGALPRKTFSMGHSYDKRFYLEARKIK